MRRKIRIGIAEDHVVVREGLESLLNEEETVKVVFSVSNGASAINEIRQNKIDVLILDLSMPISDGRSTLLEIRQRFSGVSVIVLSAYYETSDIVDCISLGAKAYLTKNCDFDHLIDVIYSVYEKGFYYDELVTKSFVSEILESKIHLKNQIQNSLTEQEIQVIQLICSGLKNKEIGERLFKSKRTIDGIRNKIYDKTRTSNTADLFRFAIKNGIYKID
ncbi:MAG: response regulator transcription factor [Bacteroidetes bacterium]|nr:MAG: response regulator transcription factor [Bacteroidota bacterium]